MIISADSFCGRALIFWEKQQAGRCTVLRQGCWTSRRGLEAGTDPAHLDYWHTCRDYDQKFCEMAAIAFGMLFCPDKIWEPQTEKGRDNLTEWLWEINGVGAGAHRSGRPQPYD